MEECKLIGTNNDGFRFEYTFNKEENFKEKFSKFLLGLDFGYGEVAEAFLVNENRIQVKIKDIKGHIRNYKNKDFDIDTFYGTSIIIVVVRTNNQDKLIKVVDDLFEFKNEH